MARTTFITTFIAVSCMVACRGPLPCQDCDIAEDDDNEYTPPPDLPCGGADLMTDNLNCGKCGHECALWDLGTKYEAGTCNAGVCGPGWSECFNEGFSFETCAEVCEALGEACVPKGCSGYTALVSEVFAFDSCDYETHPPVVTMTGGCDEPIPWMSTSSYPREVFCCCDFQ